MKITAFDTETHLIKPGVMAPRMVCSTWAEHEGESAIMLREDSHGRVRAALAGEILIAHNLTFDLGVVVAQWPDLLPLAFDALESGRLSDTMLRQKIIDNAEGELGKKGKYSLQGLVKRHFDQHLEKEDTWRLKYHLLDGTPIAKWPEEAIDYAMQDAELALKVWFAQSPEILREELTETRAAWALHLCTITGLRTDVESVEVLQERLEERWEELNAEALQYGFVRQEKGRFVRNMQDIKDLVAKHYPSEDGPPKTNSGQIQTSRDILEKCTHMGLRSLAQRSKIEKHLKTYLPVLWQGTRLPVNPGYDVIKDTYRTSSFKPNIQNLPRDGGIRECFVPREGYVYVFCDYDTLELRTLAQVNLSLFDNSSMATALREGKDLHLLAASELLSIDYEKAVSRHAEGDPQVQKARQMAKCLNFGLPGGMGAKRFVDYCAINGIAITEDRARYLKQVYLNLYPEMVDYFQWCSDLVQNGAATLEFIGTGYKRGKVHYTAAANGNFQHLAAMGAKNALWLTARECFLPGGSLLGCLPVLFLHDEIGIEAPVTQAAQAAKALERVMIEGMKKYVPDIPVTCEPVMMRRWYKGAKPVYRNGVLVPSKPIKKEGRTKWTAGPITIFVDGPTWRYLASGVREYERKGIIIDRIDVSVSVGEQLVEEAHEHDDTFTQYQIAGYPVYTDETLEKGKALVIPLTE